MGFSRRFVLALALVGVVAAPAQAQRGFAFSVDFGYTGVEGGNWADVMKDGIHAEIMLDYLFDSGVILGAGYYFVSYNLQPAFGDESISNVQPQAALGYVFDLGKVRPYAQIRGTILRLRVEGHKETTPPDEEGENTSEQRWGTGATLMLGTEFTPWRVLTFDLAGWYGAFTTQELDLSAIGGGVIDEGRAWGVQLGIKWYPSP